MLDFFVLRNGLKVLIGGLGVCLLSPIVLLFAQSELLQFLLFALGLQCVLDFAQAVLLFGLSLFLLIDRA